MMLQLWISTLMVLALQGPAVAPSPPTQSLDTELSRLHLDTALVLPSEGVDDYPLWSPAGDRLAVNADGKWQSVDLQHLALVEAKWRDGQRIGLIASRSSISEVGTPPAPWKQASRFEPRLLRLKSGVVIELRVGGEDASTSLVVTRPGGRSEVLWTSGFENCHSLVVSPDEKHVAYICELNGVLVMRAPDVAR